MIAAAGRPPLCFARLAPCSFASPSKRRSRSSLCEPKAQRHSACRPTSRAGPPAPECRAMLTIGDLASKDMVAEYFVSALGETLAADQFRVLFITPLGAGATCLAHVRI